MLTLVRQPHIKYCIIDFLKADSKIIGTPQMLIITASSIITEHKASVTT